MTVTYESDAATAAIWQMLIERWDRTIRSKALSPNTERGYLYTARRWTNWLVAEGYMLEPAEIKFFHVEEFIGAVINETSAANGAFHYRNLRVFFKWLFKREEITKNPIDGTESPRVPVKVVPILGDDLYERLLGTCTERDFCSLRDRALMMLFRDTGARVSEITYLDLDSVMLTARQLKVVGKGNKERIVGYSPDTALALARCIKARAKLLRERGMITSRLWIGRWGRPLAIDSIKRVLRVRGEQAGIAKVHAHRFRHTYAHDWKLQDGSNEGLMATGGWSSHKMAQHYGQAARATRALAEQQRLMLGKVVGE